MGNEGEHWIYSPYMTEYSGPEELSGDKICKVLVKQCFLLPLVNHSWHPMTRSESPCLTLLNSTLHCKAFIAMVSSSLVMIFVQHTTDGCPNSGAVKASE